MAHVRRLTALLLLCVLSVSGASAQEALKIIAPVGPYNFSSRPIVQWECPPDLVSVRIVLRDSNGIVMEDTDWRRRPAGKGICDLGNGKTNEGNSVGHDIPSPWPNPLSPRWIKGLSAGKYEYEVMTKDASNRLATPFKKQFDLVPNIDVRFDAGQPGKWTAISGDWGSITPSSFGAQGATSRQRVVAVYDEPVYADGKSTAGSPSNFDPGHYYSYTVSMKVNCSSDLCAAGPSFMFREPSGTNEKPNVEHLDFMVTGNGILAIEGVAGPRNGGVGAKRLATVALAGVTNVHQFFTMRVEFRGASGTTVVFVNDKKIFSGAIGGTFSDTGGKFGLAFQGLNPSDSFEAQRVLVRPSVWEGVGSPGRTPIE